MTIRILFHFIVTIRFLFHFINITQQNLLVFNLLSLQFKKKGIEFKLRQQNIRTLIIKGAMSGLHEQYQIDSLIVNKDVVQYMISQSQNANLSTTIGEVFTLCDKLIKYDKSGNDRTVKAAIKNMLQQKLTNKQLQVLQAQTLKQYRINLSQVYMLNKPGNFGRVLQRKCRLVEKGVMEYQQGKQAKLKQVKSFLNKIQHIQNKQLTDLAWLSTQPEKYRFRVILYDVNQNNKGVYFQTYEQAEGVRAYLVRKYKKTSVNNQVFNTLKYRLLEASVNALVDKIKYKSIITKMANNTKLKEVNNEESSNLSQIKFIGGGNTEPKLSFGSRVMEKELVIKQHPPVVGTTSKEQTGPKRSFMSGFLDELISQHNAGDGIKLSNKQSEKSIVQKSKIIKKSTTEALEMYNQSCRNEFFLRWRELAMKRRNRFPEKMPVQKQREPTQVQKSLSEIQKSQINNGQQSIRASRKVQNSRGPMQPKQVPMSPFNNFDDDQESQYNHPSALPLTTNPKNISSIESSPINQSSRINKVLAHSRKQQSIFTIPQRIQEEESISQTQQAARNNKKIGTQRIVFRSVEFMDCGGLVEGKEGDLDEVNRVVNKQDGKKQINRLLLFKPIITVSIYKHKKQQQQSKQKPINPRTRLHQQHTSNPNPQSLIQGQFIFNTMLKKSHRTLQYELSSTEGEGVFETMQSMNSMYMVVAVTNFLTNEEVMETVFDFNEYGFVRYGNSIVDRQAKVRMRFQYQSTGVAQPQAVYTANHNSQSSLFFSIPKIDPDIIRKIKTYWQSQAISNSYYNLQDNFNIFDAVSNSSNQAQPMNWWVDLDEKQYNYLCILKSSSVILGYKLCQPMLYVIRAVKNIHFKIEKIIQMLLSIIINLGSHYYFPQNISKVNYLHREVGLSKGKIQFQNRVFLEVLLFEKFLAFQCPQLNDRLQRKNIAISHLMLEYTYELFSRNFGIEVLCQYWSYCSEQIQRIPLIYFLTTISLCRLLSEKLMRCNRLLDLREVFQSKRVKSSTALLNDIKYLRTKYFSKGEGFIEQIKQAFEQKPFQNVLNIYLKRLSDNEAKMKRDNTRYKRELCASVLQHLQPAQALTLFTKYVRQAKKYTLHIYFYQLPSAQGKLFICTDQTEYQTLNTHRSRYFIIGEVTSRVIIKFIDYTNKEYRGQLIMNQGFNQCKIKLTSEKTEEQYEVHYLCGLLTETQVEMVKGGRKFGHFMAPNVTVEMFKDELLRPLKEVKHSEGWMTQQWFRDLRVVFSHGNKLFSQVGYFMNLLISENITHQQKLARIKSFSIQISRQYFLCDNHIVYKQLLYQFYKLTFIPVKEQDYQCYFNDSIEMEFQAPKIIKCRFVVAETNKEIKLQKELNEYWSKKSLTHLYGDLFVDEILVVCEKHLRGKVASQIQGQLKILYSTFGSVELKVIPLKLQNKKLLIDYDKQLIAESTFHDIAQKQPQLLMNEVLPSFAKISTILDYVNSSKIIDLRARSKQSLEKKVIPQCINLLKYAQSRMKNTILLRYASFPGHVKVPFYSYYSQLMLNPEIPKFQHYYVNNIKDSVKSVCLAKEQLRFSSNNKEQDHNFDKSVGLYGNLRKLENLGTQINTVFFWTQNKQDHSVPKSLIWVNYGYGVGRWESCIIKEYRKMIKRRNKNYDRTPKSRNQPKLQQPQSNNKIQYLVQKGRRKFYARDYQVKLNPGVKEHLIETRNEEEKKEELNTDIRKSLGFLLAPSNLNEFVKSLKR